MTAPATIHFVCPHDGRKLSKIPAMTDATINVRRSCPACRRRYSITVAPRRIPQGWAHIGSISEMEQKVTVIE